jgi:hypothetical protein
MYAIAIRRISHKGWVNKQIKIYTMVLNSDNKPVWKFDRDYWRVSNSDKVVERVAVQLSKDTGWPILNVRQGDPVDTGIEEETRI